jgi:hypothetical protein
MKKENFISPKKNERLESIKRKINDLSNRINSIFSDLKKLNGEKQKISNELKTVTTTLIKEEIPQIPLDIKEQINSKETNLIQIEKEILKLEKLLWGVVGQKKKSLFWKREKLDEKFRKLLAGNMLYKKEANEIAVGDLKELEEKIKEKLEQNQITITDEMNLLDLSIEVMKKYFEILDKNFYERDRNEIYDTAINEVLKEKYNISINSDLMIEYNPIETVEENKPKKSVRIHCEEYIKNKGIDLIDENISKLSKDIRKYIAETDERKLSSEYIRIELTKLKNH